MKKDKLFIERVLKILEANSDEFGLDSKTFTSEIIDLLFEFGTLEYVYKANKYDKIK